MAKKKPAHRRHTRVEPTGVQQEREDHGINNAEDALDDFGDMDPSLTSRVDDRGGDRVEDLARQVANADVPGEENFPEHGSLGDPVVSDDGALAHVAAVGDDVRRDHDPDPNTNPHLNAPKKGPVRG